MNHLDVKKIRSELGLTQEDFANQLDVNLRTVQKWEGGETKIRKGNAALIRNLYDKHTKGVVDLIDKEPEAIWVNYERFKLVPLVTHRAQAGFLAGWGDEEYMEELPKVPWEVDKEYKGRYVTFEVSGDSMESDTNPRESIFEGDLLLCREVQRIHWKNKLHIHKWDFVIVHREQGILVKRIKEHITGNGTLVLHSLNPYYEDFNVEMDDLIAIFNIVDIKRSARR